MGNCLFLRARGWGIDHQMRTKLQIPGGMPGGDMVTGRIEPCIIPNNRVIYLNKQALITNLFANKQLGVMVGVDVPAFSEE